jgi:hypothetical protein
VSLSEIRGFKSEKKRKQKNNITDTHKHIIKSNKDKKTERQRDRETERQRDRETERQTDKQTNRQTDKQTERQRDKQTVRQNKESPGFKSEKKKQFF